MSESDSLIPIIHLEPFLARRDTRSCEQIARAVREVGTYILRDPRIPSTLPSRMRELFLEFYRKPESYKRRYERIDRHRQVGWQPPGEKARTREEERLSFPDSERPHPYGGVDVKERFSVPIGPAPVSTDFPSLNQKDPEIPEGIKDWLEYTTMWGDYLLAAICTSVEMAGIGMGMTDPELFLRMTSHGPHILAPTGCDLKLQGKPGIVHANFHTDMGFATGHGRSNYPGLFVWTREKKRIPARLPDDGCVLIQVGKQWQILTGGAAHAGFHEVVATEEMWKMAQEELAKGIDPWRVSSTLFAHVTSNEILKPYDIFDVPGAWTDGPPQRAGDRMLNRLKRSGLSVTEVV